jgi:hypothetical protein
LAKRFVLIATARLDGAVLQEARVSAGEALEVGRRGDLDVPVPSGVPFVARARWRGPAEVEVEDGRGAVHTLGPDGNLEITLGPLSVELALAEALTLRRTEPVPVYGSLAFLTVLLGMSVLLGQMEVIERNLCAWFGVNCPVVQTAGGIAGGMQAEYLARLLREDYEGVENGVIVQRTPEIAKESPGFMPAGDIGPVTEFGGAEQVAPEPVRAAEHEEETAPPARSEQPERAIETSEAGTPVTPPAEVVLDGQAEVDDGLDTDAEKSDEPEPEVVPAEEKKGWGVRDWMDASAAEREKMEVDMMTDLAQQRLKIDPNDLEALGILSYYQYLQGDLDAAQRTFDRLIELTPEDPAGYNNQALVFKRRGDYQREEGLYRVALALDPMDHTALNNLAVNLAHQKRFDEALFTMERVELLAPGDPYSDLHRSKIYAEMGDDETALVFLRRALEGMANLDVLHHIEFRQDIRVDPSFAKLRDDARFRAILTEYYGADTPLKE